MVALAWVGTSALHATWNTSSFVEAFSYLAVGVGGVFLVSCLLKARQLERSLGRTVDTYGSIVVQPRQPAPAPAPQAAPQTTPQSAPAPSAPQTPAASSSPPPAGGAIRLMFPSGPVPVVMGAQLDLAHLSADIRAEVTQHPSRADVLGLRNNGAASWSATLRDGSVQQIDAGRNIRLAPGVKIDFGGGVVAEVVG